MPLVVGMVRSIDGTPYEGAIIEVSLSNQIIRDNSFVGNETVTVFSDSYGRFYLPLEPSPEGTYYTFKVTKDTVTEYLRSVPDSAGEVNFEDLPVHIPASSGSGFIGNC